MKSFLFVVAAVALLGGVARADDFSNCFCFNANGTWCGTTQDALNGFDRDSCRNVAINALLWTIPAFVLFLGFFFFPFFFCAFRYCCNCCGGREPTDGCCCPSRPSVRVFDDGREEVIPKKYSNRSIFCTKFFYAVCFGFWIYYSVGVYVINHNVDDAFMSATGGINDQTDKIYDVIVGAVNATEQLSQNGATFLDDTVIPQLVSAKSQYREVQHDIHEIISHLQEAESNQQYGRNQDAYRVPSVPMIILFPVFLLMFCNVRGHWMIGASFLMCLASMFVVAAFIGHELIAQVSTAVCSHYNDTLVPSLTNAVIWGNGCGVQSVVDKMDTSASEYFSQVCQMGLSTLCDNSSATPYFSCPSNAFQDLCQQAAAIGMSSVTGWKILSELLNNTVATSVSDAALSGCTSCSFAQCAVSCTAPQAQQASQSLVTFLNNFQGPTSELLENFYPSYTNCNAIRTALESDDIHGTICGTFSTKFTNISIQFLALSIDAIAAVILLIMGAKRFTKMESIQDEADPTATVPLNASTFAYRVLLQDDNERAVMGSPILSNDIAVMPQQQPHPVVQGGYVAPGGYGAVNGGGYFPQAAPAPAQDVSLKVMM